MSDALETAPVKTVGFAFFSPEVVVLFADHDRDKIHIFPPKNFAGFSVEAEARRNLVLVRSLDKISKLSDFHQDIHRMLVFGEPEKLLKLGIPLMDADVKDGKATPLHRQTRDTLLERIETEAVEFDLLNPTKANELDDAAKSSGEGASEQLTFVSQLRDIREKVGGELDFVTEVGAPSVLRIMAETTRAQFKDVCKNLHKKGGLPEKEVRSFFRWVESLGEPSFGGGLRLGKAVDALLYPAEGTKVDEAELANRYMVNQDDLKFVSASYLQIIGEENPE